MKMKQPEARPSHAIADSPASLAARADVRGAFLLRIGELTLRELTWPINRMTLGHREDPGSEALARVVSQHATRGGADVDVPSLWKAFDKLVRLAAANEIDAARAIHQRHRCLFPIDVERLERLVRQRSNDNPTAKEQRRDLSLLLHYMAGDAPADVNRARDSAPLPAAGSRQNMDARRRTVVVRAAQRAYLAYLLATLRAVNQMDRAEKAIAEGARMRAVGEHDLVEAREALRQLRLILRRARVP